MKKAILMLLLLIGFSTLNQVIAQDNFPQPKIIALKFHADWCGTCRAMGPVFEDLTEKFDGKPVLFYRLDFTNTTTKFRTFQMAAALGLDEIVKQNNGTGFILLIDIKSKKVLEKLTKDMDIKTMEAKIKEHL